MCCCLRELAFAPASDLVVLPERNQWVAVPVLGMLRPCAALVVRQLNGMKSAMRQVSFKAPNFSLANASTAPGGAVTAAAGLSLASAIVCVFKQT